MRNLRKFNTVTDASTAGTSGLVSPHVDIINEVGSVNMIKTDTEAFTCSFNSSGKAENITPVATTETWYFNERIVSDYIDDGTGITCVDFTSNNKICTAINAYSQELMIYDGVNTGNLYEVYNHYGWLDQAWRTIILDEPATGDLLTFLQANATKIS